jgi:alpha-D-xyloside xylohydrolase
MRSLAFDFKDDANIASIPDQYMFGPAFLVNPVTERMYSNENNKSTTKTRKVYLPESAQWYDFWTGELLKGGQTIDALTPIETIPLYIKAGSIVPMGPFLQYATEKPADPIEIRIYPGANGSFVLYEDENDTYTYEKGSYSTIAFEWNDARRQLTIGKRQGTFPGMLINRVFNISIVHSKYATGVDITPKPDKVVNYQGKSVSINFN